MRKNPNKEIDRALYETIPEELLKRILKELLPPNELIELDIFDTDELYEIWLQTDQVIDKNIKQQLFFNKQFILTIVEKDITGLQHVNNTSRLYRRYPDYQKFIYDIF